MRDWIIFQGGKYIYPSLVGRIAIELSDPRRKDEKGIAVSRYRTTRFSFLLPPLASILRTPYERRVGREIHN